VITITGSSDHDRPEQMITITGMYTRRLLNCDDYHYWPGSCATRLWK